jgi:hypothetical protein
VNEKTSIMMRMAVLATEGGPRLRQSLENGTLFSKPIGECDQADAYALALLGGFVVPLGIHGPWLANVEALLNTGVCEPSVASALAVVVRTLGPLNPDAAGVNDYHIVRCAVLDFPANSVSYIRSRLDGSGGSGDQRGTIHWAVNSLIKQNPGTKWGELFGGLVDVDSIPERHLCLALEKVKGEGGVQ